MSIKIKRLQEYMIAEKIDLVFLDDPTTVAYFTNFESNPLERIVAFVASQTDYFLFVPGLDIEAAKTQATIKPLYVYSDEENPWEILAKKAKTITKHLHSYRVDESTMTIERDIQLQQALRNEFPSNHSILREDIGEVIHQMRMIKTDEEIEKMIEAGKLADEAIQIGIDSLIEGITEQEVVAKIELEMKNRGVSEMSFPTMVLFGDNAAKPHGNPGDRPLKQNEFVLFDLGVIYKGYASDVTRTVAFGTVDARLEEIYETVLLAQKTAQEAVKPGMRAGELDQIARQIISDAGYGQYFTHRLGHGIGKTAHESPSIHGLNETILESGMCFSLEPGIYIPGDVGIRIEDCVYVTETGCEPLTTTTKELTSIIR